VEQQHRRRVERAGLSVSDADPVDRTRAMDYLGNLEMDCGPGLTSKPIGWTRTPMQSTLC
jgi:hypothetical protein